MLSIIVAMSEDGVIGRGGELPWHLPADLQHFKSLTMGHAMIMGRKTFDSIGRALPGRTSIVLTRRGEIRVPGVLTARSLNEALDLTPGDAEVFVIGGGELFAQALPRADRLYVTIVHTRIPDGDTYFPQVDLATWQLVIERHRQADDENAHAMTFRMYERLRK